VSLICQISLFRQENILPQYRAYQTESFERFQYLYSAAEIFADVTTPIAESERFLPFISQHITPRQLRSDKRIYLGDILMY
jgi:hypothetical protein